MSSDRLITIAIHTFERAHRMKALLETHGVKVALQNVNLTNPSISSGVRVRIAESDLPLALRIVENAEIFSPEVMEEKSGHQTVLVPVDFSDDSFKACMAAFRIAAIHNAKIHLLHSYIDPTYTARASMQLSETLDFEPGTDVVEDMQMNKEIVKAAEESMRDFETKLREKMKHGVLPPAKFDSEIMEGVPEECIDTYARQHRPILVVMGTNGSDDTNRHLFGSVTAEVLDNCRSTVLTVPASASMPAVPALSHAIFFASSSQDDILTLDALYRLLPETPLDITLVSINQKEGDRNDENLLTYCKEHYPAYRFSRSPLSLSNPVDDYNKIVENHKVDLIVLGTRKRNIFARLFSPTLAHRLLFHADTPLLSIPV